MKLTPVIPLTSALLASLATPSTAGLAAPGAAVGIDAEPRTCVAQGIGVDEAEEGATVEIRCAERPALVRSARAGDVVMAVHYSGLGGTGSSLSIYGASDCSEVVVFGATDPWNDAIESTRPRACGNVKHFAGSGLTGENEVVSGSTTTNLTTLRNRTSSIGYGA